MANKFQNTLATIFQYGGESSPDQLENLVFESDDFRTHFPAYILFSLLEIFLILKFSLA